MSGSEEVWFLGRVSRTFAEDLLYSAGINGSFVIRSSESVPGAYALTVFYNKAVHTYRIVPTENRMLAVQTMKGLQHRKFATLTDLVREYRSPQNGLICGLTNPIGYEGSASIKNPTSESFLTVPRNDPLPAIPTHSAPPPPVASKSMHHNFGIKVMPNIPAVTAQTPNSSIEKLRDLPPVPVRDSSKTSSKISLSRVPSTGRKNDDIKEKLLARLNEFKSIWPNLSDFLDIIQSYAKEDGLQSDLSNIRSSCSQCASLQTLLAREAVTFQSELETFLTKIDMLRQLFDFSSAPRRTVAYNRTAQSDVDLDTFLGRLGDCRTVVKSLNMRVCINLQEQLGLSGGFGNRALKSKKSRVIEPLREKTFEVKHEGALKFSRQKLKLDISQGKLFIIKGDGSTEHDSSKVLQLIKSKKSKNKLTLVLDGVKNREYAFEKSKEREAFCQLLQYMRNKDSASSEPDCVSLFCGSWNMGDAMPPIDISSWFLCNGLGRSLDPSVQSIPHDIYVVGTQETGMPEKDWHAKVLETLQDITGANFHVVATDALWHIKILVIVKEEHKNRISHVQTSTVKTGIANALGNKGAVAVSFQFGGTSFCFINAHLTSGWEKCVRRNQNYHDIVRSLNVGENSLKIFDLTNRFDHLYFFGDLNYRLEKETGDIQEVLSLIKKKDLNPLLNFDQLKREKELSKAFGGFSCSEDIMTSDHSPLFSNFQVGVRGQYISKDEITPSSASFIPSFVNFVDIEVTLTNTSKQNFCLQFHSACLTKSTKSGRGSKFDANQSIGVGVKWGPDHLPSLKPIISDREYLLDQHILLCICSEEDNEVQGECVIALKSKIINHHQHFDEVLTKKGEKAGQIKGQLVVQTRDQSTAPKEKTYDFIRRDDDEAAAKKHMVEEAPEYAEYNIPLSSKPPHPSSDHQRSKFNRVQSLPVDNENDGKVKYANTGDAVRNEPMIFSSSRNDSPTKTPNMSLTSETTAHNQDGSRTIGRVKQPAAEKPAFRNRLFQEERSSHPHSSSTGSSLFHSASLDSCFSNSPPPPGSLPRPPAPTGFLPRPPAPSNFLPPPPTSNNPLPSPPAPARSLIRPRAPGNPNSPPFNHSLPPHPTSPEFPAPPAVRKVKSTMIDDLELGDTFAEFKNVDNIFNSSAHYDVLQNRNDQSCVTSSSPDSIYQSPKSIPVQPQFFPIVDSPRLKNSPSSSPVFKQASHKVSSPSGFPRRPTQVRGIPSTVDEFLSLINLNQYSNLLHDNGWDSIEFLGEMTEDDLIEIGVTDPQHCRMILEHIKSLPL